MSAGGYAGTSYEPTWTTRQVAEFLGIKPRTVYKRKGWPGFPVARKHGKLNAFIPSEVAAYRAQVLGLNEVEPVVVTAGQNI